MQNQPELGRDVERLAQFFQVSILLKNLPFILRESQDERRSV